MDNIEDILRALAEDAPEDSSSESGASQENSGEGIFSGLDIGSMAKIAGLLSAAGNTSDDERLLMALKPLLREENRGKVDTALRLLKLIALLPLLKESGLFGNLGDKLWSGILSSLRFTARWSRLTARRESLRKRPAIAVRKPNPLTKLRSSFPGSSGTLPRAVTAEVRAGSCKS